MDVLVISDDYVRLHEDDTAKRSACEWVVNCPVEIVSNHAIIGCKECPVSLTHRKMSHTEAEEWWNKAQLIKQ